MDFNNLVTKLNSIENNSNESFDQPVQNYTDSVPIQQPTEMPDPSPNMNVNLNAQGLDNIESIMQLFGKINANPDMQQPIEPSSQDTTVSTISPLDAQPNDTMSFDMDSDVDSDMDSDFDSDMDSDFDSDIDSDFDSDEYSFSTGSSQKLLPKESSEKSFKNEVDPLEGDFDDIITSGDDLHKSKKTFPKTASGDNPRNKISYNEDFYNQIKRDLRKKLNEVKSRARKSRRR